MKAIKETLAGIGDYGRAHRALMRGGAFANPLKAYQRKGCGCGPKLDGTPHWPFWTEAPRVSLASMRSAVGRWPVR